MKEDGNTDATKEQVKDDEWKSLRMIVEHLDDDEFFTEPQRIEILVAMRRFLRSRGATLIAAELKPKASKKARPDSTNKREASKKRKAAALASKDEGTSQGCPGAATNSNISSQVFWRCEVPSGADEKGKERYVSQPVSSLYRK